MGLIRPVHTSPIVRGFSRAIDRISGRDILRQELLEGRALTKRLSEEIDRLETRLVESSRKDKTGISAGWGYTSKDMDAAKHGKLRNLCESAATSHPLAKKALRMKRNFVCQEGFKLEACYEGDPVSVNGETLSPEQIRECVQDYLDAHWEINWEGKLESRVESLAVVGEFAAWMPPADSETGQFRLGVIDSQFIDSITPDPLNIERAEAIKLSQALEFQVCGKKAARSQIEIVEKCWRTNRYTGEMLYLGINTLGTRHRGMSDLTPVIDYLDVFDQLVWTEAERVKALRSMMFHYKMIGEKSEETIKRKQAEMRRNPPPPGSWIVSNESVGISEICPNINTAPTLEYIKFIFGLCAGCLDLPEHFYYSAGNVNRASAREMTDPVYAGVRDRKREIVSLLYTEFEYALQRAAEVLSSCVAGFTREMLAFRIVSRDPERDALDVIGQHLVSLGQALVVYKQEGWISDLQAGSIARQEISSLGLGEIDAPEDTETAEDSLKKLQNQFERVRNIGGKAENFPLSPDPEGKRDWAFTGQQTA